MAFKALQASIQQQRKENHEALKMFPYFDSWDEEVTKECCRLGKINTVGPDVVILGNGQGNRHMVYFMLTGSCRLIECMKLIGKRTKTGRKTFQYYEGKDDGSFMSESNGKSTYSSLLFTQGLQIRPEVKKLETQDSQIDIVVTNVEVATRDVQERDEEPQVEALDVQEEKDGETDIKMVEVVGGREIEQETSKVEEMKIEIVPADDETEIKQQQEKEINVLEDLRVQEQLLDRYRRDSFLRKTSADDRKLSDMKQKNYESHFMQIAILSPGQCFGIGENLSNRFIISITQVKYLMLPVHFLMRHNPCNVWNRIKRFLNTSYPNKKKLLHHFQLNLKWAEFKNNETIRVTSSRKIPNCTLINDVPLTIRINERIGNFELLTTDIYDRKPSAASLAVASSVS